jgi:hypothetical protein
VVRALIDQKLLDTLRKDLFAIKSLSLQVYSLWLIIKEFIDDLNVCSTNCLINNYLANPLSVKFYKSHNFLYKLAIFASMKRGLVFLYCSIMLAVLTSPTPTTVFGMPLKASIESVEDICTQNEDACSEDQSFDNWHEAIFFPLADLLPSGFSVKGICGIIPFKWQPPE